MLFPILFTIISLIIISRSILKSKILSNLISFIIFWNGIWLIISTYNFFDLYEVSDRAYFYQLIGLISLTIGFLVPNGMSSFIKNKKTLVLDYKLLNYRSQLFKILVVTFLVFSLYGVYRYNFLIQGIGAYESRGAFFSNQSLIFGHRYLGYLWNWVFAPFFYIILPLFTISFLLNFKKDIWTYIYVVCVLLFGYIGGGRAHYVIILQTFVVAIIILYNKRLSIITALLKMIFNVKRIHKTILLISILICMISVVAFITSSRRGNTELSYSNIREGAKQFFEDAIIYQIGPYRAFDYGLNNNYIDQIGQLYGRGTFGGIEDMLTTTFSLIGENSVFYPVNNQIANVMQANQIEIGYHRSINFAYTALMIFYLDFKLFGIIIIPLLLGYFFRRSTDYFFVNSNIFSFSLLLFLSLVLLEFNFRYGIQTMDKIILIISTLYFSSKKKINKLHS